MATRCDIVAAARSWIGTPLGQASISTPRMLLPLTSVSPRPT